MKTHNLRPTTRNPQQLISQTIDDLLSIASEILATYPDQRIFAFYGSMGAGKTTLIKAFCKVLDVQDITSSPSFAIVNNYRSLSGVNVYHFDFYRIKNIEEVLDIGYEDYFYCGDYCFIEWPEKILQLLPGNSVNIKITVSEADDSRIINYF